MRRFAKALAAAGVLSSLTAVAAAQTPALVVDAHTGQVLIAEEATRPWNPASTTKMMTAYVALRAVKAGRLQMDTPLIASARAAAQRPSKIGIRPGQEITLDNALKIIMVKSANDVAVVIAEAIGGSIEGFSRMMNAEARRLGMTETRFLNPHGFHEEGHQTSARDLAILARAMLLEFPEHADLWGIGAVRLGARTMNNTNGLIGRYAGAVGMKTGFVCASGFNLVSVATRGGRTLIAVVLGASSGGDRVVRSAQLLDRAFASWGGTGQTLESLPRSWQTAAPNMRSEICSGRRRGVILADDADYGGAILANTQTADAMSAGSPLAFFSQGPSAPTSRVYGVGSGGRAILGPRMAFDPIPVHLGRAPGSTAVALGPGARAATQTAAAPASRAVPGLPPAAAALAAPEPRPAAAAAIRPAAQQASAPAAGAPLQLPGVVTGPARPAAQAAIRPRPAAAQSARAPAAAPSRPPAARKAETRPAAGPARPATAAKAKAQRPKAAPERKQPAGRD